jgi:chromosome segregation ATPase
MTVGEIMAALAIIGTVYSIFMQGRTGNIELALKLRKEMQSDREEYRTEAKSLHEKIEALESQLALMREQLRKREDEMIDLQERFDQDALLRANVEMALKVSNAKIIELTQRVSALEDERDQLKAERDRLLVELTAQQAKQTSGL